MKNKFRVKIQQERQGYSLEATIKFKVFGGSYSIANVLNDLDELRRKVIGSGK